MRRSVLWVDDEEVVLSMLQAFSEQQGYRTFAAHDGVEALGILEDEEVDTMVTDVAMPGMDGLALAERVKALYPKVWVVGTSGALKASMVEELPFDVFLRKPFGLAQLRAALVGDVG